MFAGGALASIVVATQLRAGETVDRLEDGAPTTASDASPPLADGALPAPTGSVRAAPTAGASSGPARSSELDGATTVDALKTLADRHPNDPKVWRKLAVTQFESGAPLESAVASAKQAFLRDQDAAEEDERLRTLVLRAASGPANAADLAFEILTDHTGESGPDLLYELIKAKSVGDRVRDRARIAMQWPRVRDRMSPALAIASKLDASKSVCERVTLAAEAEKNGDSRSLVYLEGGLSQVCNKFNFMKVDCSACVGDGSTLHRAIKAIRDRGKTAPSAKP